MHTSTSSRKKQDPPLVSLRVTNPITYIKKWWASVTRNEGIDFRFRIRPLTAIALTAVIASIGFGVGNIVLPYKLPFFEYNNPTPSPTPSEWKETAFIGTLKYSELTKKFFLITSSSSEAITLQVPENINFTKLVEKRIFAAGSYNKSQKVLIVLDAKDMEVLPKSPVPIPTVSPTPAAIPTLAPSDPYPTNLNIEN